ncbi:hypothetical protein CUJ84_Chr004529 [Rhizobium leguminosarum]|uniref:Uncharacterized protein n=1 Tax=Rhizobium leguminosarum TaxID=384 RepID=A0A2K9Z9A1_RHILE|nr:hypothetical protein CUJ84_Chr004529 [Rhizobium leguminosarum]
MMRRLKCYSVLARETRGAVVRPNVADGTLAICGGSGKLSLSCHMWRPCETDDRSAGFATRRKPFRRPQFLSRRRSQGIQAKQGPASGDLSPARTGRDPLDLRPYGR